MARPFARRFLDRYAKFIESLERKQGKQPSPSSPSTMPSISSIFPNSTKAEQFTLTINGSYFDPGAVDQLYTPSGQYTGSGVQFGRLISRSSNQIVVRENLTNAQAGIYTIRVRNSDGKLSNPINIVVTANIPTFSPTVSMSPPSGVVGTTLTQIGKDFSPSSTVSLYGRKPDGSQSQITTVRTDSIGAFSRTWKADTPGSNFAWWAVDNATGKKSNEVVYNVTPPPPAPPLVDSQKLKEKVEEFFPILKKPPPPEVTRIEPSSGAPGITIKIYGNNLNPQGAVLSPSLIFEAPYRPRATGDIVPPINNNELSVIVPMGSGSMEVHVETVRGSSSKHKFIFKEPHVDNILPAYGKPRTEVVIKGKDFGFKKGISPNFWVKFGNSHAEVKSWNNTEILARVPSDYGTGLNDANFIRS